MTPKTDQQRMLADAARQFAAAEHTPARLRACRDRHPDFDRPLWESLAALGWLGVLVPEQDGGLGAGFGDMAQLVHAWGRACAPEPLVACGVLAARTLVHAAGPARAHLLGALVEGRLVPAMAAGEGAVTCTLSASGAVLNGTRRFVVPAHADGYMVQSGAGLWWVPREAAGLRIAYERRADGSQAARLTLENVWVDATACIDAGNAAAARALDEARVLAAVEMSGMMDAMLELTLDYLRTRVQFGKPIGSFQALQHRAVDLYIAAQLAGDVAQAACASLDSGAQGDALALAAARAKARAGDALDRIAREAVQLHGAIGFTDEYALGLYVNRALTLSAWLGNAAQMRERYAQLAPPLEVMSA
jgi:alkylation response protein AidB-like acyl-CoA dehydrogenase